MPSAVPVIRTIEQARTVARRLYPTSPGFQSAFVKGYVSGRAGHGIEACPYLGGTRRGSRSWRPAWRAAWMRGQRHGARTLAARTSG